MDNDLVVWWFTPVAYRDTLILYIVYEYSNCFVQNTAVLIIISI